MSIAGRFHWRLHAARVRRRKLLSSLGQGTAFHGWVGGVVVALTVLALNPYKP